MLDSTESLSENSGLSGSLLTKSSLKSASASVQSLLSPQSTELSQSESLSSLGLEIVLYQREKKGAKAFQLTEASFITSIVARVPSPIEWDKSCYSYVGLRLFASGQNVILVERTCLLLKLSWEHGEFQQKKRYLRITVAAQFHILDSVLQAAQRYRSSAEFPIFSHIREGERTTT